jgi:hypothetical protein
MSSITTANDKALIDQTQSKPRLHLVTPDAKSPAPVETGAESGSLVWILHPAIDLLLCCGGVVWLLFAFHYFIVAPANNQVMVSLLSLLVIVGTHVLSETHTSATLVRAYKNGETRARYSLYTRWAALACGALALAGLFIAGFTPILAKLYLVWVVQHFTAQTYGMTLLYCYKNNYKLSNKEKFVLASVLNLTAVQAIVRQFTFKDWNGNGFLAQVIPFWGPMPEWIYQTSLILLTLAIGAFCLVGLRKLFFERLVFPLPAALMLFTGVAIFLVGKDVAGVLWLYVPAFYHGAQYVVLTAAQHLKEQGLPEGMSTGEMWKLLGQSAGLRYVGILLLGAIAIYIGVPRLLQDCGFDYSLAFATVFCAVNLHHFLTDQAIWKLRDPKLRKSLAA